MTIFSAVSLNCSEIDGSRFFLVADSILAYFSHLIFQVTLLLFLYMLYGLRLVCRIQTGEAA